jgi:hypothetical protein
MMLTYIKLSFILCLCHKISRLRCAILFLFILIQRVNYYAAYFLLFYLLDLTVH